MPKDDKPLEGLAELVELHMTPEKAEFSMRVQPDIIKALAHYMAEAFKAAGGEYHVLWEIQHEELGGLEMIMRRTWLGAPERVIALRRAERDEARAEVAVRDRALKMMHEAALRINNSVAASHALAFPDFWIVAARENIEFERDQQRAKDGEERRDETT